MPQCPSCRSQNVARFEVIHNESPWSQLGMQLGPPQRRGVFYAMRYSFFPSILAWGIAYFGIKTSYVRNIQYSMWTNPRPHTFYAHHPLIATLIAVVVFVAITALAYRRTHNDDFYSALYTQWRESWYCRACGHTFRYKPGQLGK